MPAFTATTLTTRQLVLSPLHPADAGPMAAVLGDPRLHEFIGGSPASPAALADRYRRLAAGSPDPAEIWLNWIVRLRASAEPVGTVQATVTRRSGSTAVTEHASLIPTAPVTPVHAARVAPVAVVAWVIGVPWQGNGYATEAARALVQWLESQGATEITANIHPDHHASAAVAAAAGMAVTDAEVDGEQVWQYRAG